MAIFFLVRHASHDLLGKVLAGRAPEVHLNGAGKVEAERVAKRLASRSLAGIHTSPLERAMETAWPIAAKAVLEPVVNAAFNEIDFGEWTLSAFALLAPLPTWQQWNSQRSKVTPPRGESMQAAQTRAIRELEHLAALNGDQELAIVSHGDLIKSVLLYYLAMSLDDILRFEVDPASISIVQLSSGRARVLSVNCKSTL